MQRASSSLITKEQEMLKNQTPSLGNQTEIDDFYCYDDKTIFADTNTPNFR